MSKQTQSLSTTHTPVDGPVIVIGAHDELLGAYNSLTGAHVMAKKLSTGYREAWVWVSVPGTMSNRWMKKTYFYNGMLASSWNAPAGCTWEQLVWDQRADIEEEKPMVQVKRAGAGT